MGPCNHSHGGTGIWWVVSFGAYQHSGRTTFIRNDMTLVARSLWVVVCPGKVCGVRGKVPEGRKSTSKWNGVAEG